MHRVHVAWDVAEAKRLLRLLASHGIRGCVLEDREFPERGELNDSEGAPEVWINDVSLLPRAFELAAEFEAQRRGALEPPAPPEPPDSEPPASDEPVSGGSGGNAPA